MTRNLSPYVIIIDFDLLEVEEDLHKVLFFLMFMVMVILLSPYHHQQQQNKVTFSYL